MPINFEPVRKCLICGTAIGFLAAHVCDSDAYSKALLDLTKSAALLTEATATGTSSIAFNVKAPGNLSYKGFFRDERPDRGSEVAPPPAERPTRVT